MEVQRFGLSFDVWMTDCIPESEAAAGSWAASSGDLPAAAAREGGTSEEGHRPSELSAQAAVWASRDGEGADAPRQRQVSTQKSTGEGELTDLLDKTSEKVVKIENKLIFFLIKVNVRLHPAAIQLNLA